MTLIERLVPVLRSIVKVLKPASLHIGLTQRDLCVACLPARAVGPRRLGDIIRKIGLEDGFFVGAGGILRGASVFSSGSQGAYRFQVPVQPELYQSEPQLIRPGNFPPMLWIVLDQYALPMGEWRALPFVVDLPVYLNGRLLDLHQIYLDKDSFRRIKRFRKAWQTPTHRGWVYYNPGQSFTTILQGDQLTTRSNFPSSLFVVVTDGPVIQEYDLFLQALAKALRASMLPAKALRKKEKSGEPIGLEEFGAWAAAKNVAALLDGDYESQRTLALMLGMGIREYITRFDFGYTWTASFSIAAFWPRPVVLEGYSRMACMLLPAEIPAVAAENAPPYAPRRLPRVMGIKAASLDVEDLLNVWLVDRIEICGVSVPCLLVEPGSQIELESGEKISGAVPGFLIALRGRPIWEIWWELAQDKKGLKLVLLMLLEFAGEKAYEHLGAALSIGRHSGGEPLDSPLFAMRLIQRACNQNKAQQAYTAQGERLLGDTAQRKANRDDEELRDSQGLPSKDRILHRQQALEKLRRPAWAAAPRDIEKKNRVS